MCCVFSTFSLPFLECVLLESTAVGLVTGRSSPAISPLCHQLDNLLLLTEPALSSVNLG